MTFWHEQTLRRRRPTTDRREKKWEDRQEQRKGDEQKAADTENAINCEGQKVKGQSNIRGRR